MNRGRILVVDDSLTVRKLIEMSFHGRAVALDFATSGRDAIARACARVPDVILLDYVLPDMKGVDVCRQLSLVPGMASARIIVLSGKSDKVAHQFAGYPGVVACLGKPFTPDELVARVTDLLPAPARSVDPRPIVGELRQLPVFDLLRVLAATSRTGELTVDLPTHRLQIFLVRGEVMALSSPDPQRYCEGAAPLAAIDREAWRLAEAEQRASGTPVYVTLYDGGHLGEHDTDALVRARSRALLPAAVDVDRGRFGLRERAAPAWVAAHGAPIGLLQARLDGLRGRSAWSAVGRCVPSLDVVFERSSHFSHTLGQLQLAAVERRLLSLIDGQRHVQALIDRSGLGERETLLILHRAHEVGLVQRRAHAAVRTLGDDRGSSPVLIVDGDVAGVHEPLRRLLAARAEPLALVGLDGVSDCVTPIQRERPRLAILNATLIGSEAERTAQVITASDRDSAPALVAVLEAASPRRAARLRKTGFDAVLTKPFHLADLEPFLTR